MTLAFSKFKIKFVAL